MVSNLWRVMRKLDICTYKYKWEGKIWISFATDLFDSNVSPLTLTPHVLQRPQQRLALFPFLPLLYLSIGLASHHIKPRKRNFSHTYSPTIKSLSLMA